ncbi:hypothetical protein KC865_01565 [Candidatus Kaiserbacteria bacterium]|nr:hypothetical protein [Candidatus Kaiserbacteria bacterium]
MPDFRSRRKLQSCDGKKKERVRRLKMARKAEVKASTRKSNENGRKIFTSKQNRM